MPPQSFYQRQFGDSSQDFAVVDVHPVSQSFENLKRAAGQMLVNESSNDSSNSFESKSSGISSGEKSSRYSFFPPKRRARHATIVSSVLPEISILAAPPVAETDQNFGWADFPQSSRHFHVDRFLNTHSPDEVLGTR